MPCYPPFTGDSQQLLLYKIASCLADGGPGGAGVTSFNGLTGPVTGVTSFNGRDGVVVLTLADVAAVADGRYVLKTGDTMTGALVHPDGTAALPSITFTGDLDTGIYHPAADTVGFTVAGAAIAGLTSTGLGIGTLAPSFRLELVGTASVANRKIGINGTQVVYLPAQGAAAFDGSLFVGSGGTLLTHAAADEGQFNTAVGLNSSGSLTTGNYNSALGYNALNGTTTGAANIAIGFQSLMGNLIGGSNIAIGFQALTSNTGNNNAALGTVSMFSNTSGENNSAFGYQSLFTSTTSSNNTAIGVRALFDLTTATVGNNTALGFESGRGITTGINNTILGANVTGLAAGLSNNIIIADGAGNQRIQVGSTGIVTIPIALTLATAAPLSMASGANQRAGDAVLVGGTVTVANTTVTANTRVYLTRKVVGGTIGFAVTYTVIAATSFTITSDNVLDTSTYSYLLIEVP